MKVAILGSGGREAAIAWKIMEHHGPDSVLVIPGNAGTPSPDTEIDIDDAQQLAEFCKKNKIDMVIPGSETQLVSNLVGRLAEAGGPPMIGPDGQAALLEGSKILAKKFMLLHGVATAPARIVPDIAAARKAVRDFPGGKVVIKFDGLAAGKGVWVCNSFSDAAKAIDYLEQKHGPKTPVILEEILKGDELSLIGFTDGNCFRLLMPAQDHKQAFDNDKGPNTGGMGAFCPVSWCDDVLLDRINRQIIQPTMQGIKAEKLNYRGPLYFGVMITESGPKLLEYNVRFGDPETQVLLPMLETDLVELYKACHNGCLKNIKIKFRSGSCVGVVLANESYPESSTAEIPFSSAFPPADLPPELQVFQAGMVRREGRFYAKGGRILTVSARGTTLESARASAYDLIEKLQPPATRFRSDIGCRKQIITGAKKW